MTTLLAAAAIVALEQLGWLSGQWAGTTSNGVRMEEQWTSPAGGLMLGIHRDVIPSKKTSFEFLRIEQRESGPVYVAMPGGGPSTDFPLKWASGEKVTFENERHDFPQRIIYWRESERLCARVEGEIGGKTESEQWCWDRAK